MSYSIKEENGTLICLKYDHNQPVKVVIMEGDVRFEDKFLCEICQKTIQQVTKNIGIEQAITMMDEKNTKEQNQENKIQSNINQLRELENKFVTLQSEILQSLNGTVNLIKMWVNELEKIKENSSLISLIKRFEHYFGSNEQKNNMQSEIKRVNENYSVKIKGSFTNLLNILKQYVVKPFFKQPQDNTRNETHNLQTQPTLPDQQLNQSKSLQNNKPLNQILVHTPSLNTQIQLQVRSVSLIRSVRQTDYFQALAFNHTGQLLIAGCRHDIIVQKFYMGQLSESKALKGHENFIHCIVTSKLHNWFATSGEDLTIRGWKQQSDGEWLSTEPGRQHKDIVMCLLLNSFEDELLSCSEDATIISWKVNCHINQLTYNYTLDKKHKNQVYCISLNQLETTLVSCSEDKTIIIWNRDKKNKWAYKHHISNDDYGYRISFIDNNLIAWQQCHNGITHIFEIVQGNIVRKPQMNIELDEQAEDQWLFPTILNYEKKIIVQRHNQNVYILQRYANGQLKIVWQQANLPKHSNYGALSNDGQCLILWNYDLKEFLIFQIHYQ